MKKLRGKFRGIREWNNDIVSPVLLRDGTQICLIDLLLLLCMGACLGIDRWALWVHATQSFHSSKETGSLEAMESLEVPGGWAGRSCGCILLLLWTAWFRESHVESVGIGLPPQ